MSKADYIPLIIGLTIAAIFISITIITVHDGQAQTDYYVKDIKKHLSSESCSELNGSRSIYDPAQQNNWIKSDSLVDEVYKEKCQ